jgi:hypothetical protein
LKLLKSMMTNGGAVPLSQLLILVMGKSPGCPVTLAMELQYQPV